MSSSIDHFYAKTIFEKFNGLKKAGIYEHKDFSLETNFPQYHSKLNQLNLNTINFNCECEACTSKIQLDLVTKSRLDRQKLHIKKTQIKNSIYNCSIRINLILNLIYAHSQNNSTNIIIVVPIEQPTINKIANLIQTHSQGRIFEIPQNKLVYGDTTIYLLSPQHFAEGFESNPNTIGLVLLNCFYSHMFLNSLNYEELIYMCWKFRSNNSESEQTKFTVILDSDELFDKENKIMEKLCLDLKMSFLYK